jgi:hypothetical protein
MELNFEARRVLSGASPMRCLREAADLHGYLGNGSQRGNTTFEEFTFTTRIGHPDRALDSSTVFAILREFAHVLQVTAIVCIGFVLWSLLETEHGKNGSKLVSRAKR